MGLGRISPGSAGFEERTFACSTCYRFEKVSFPLDPLKTDASASWFDSVDFPVGTAASGVSVLTTPISRIRMVIVTLTAGSLRMQTQQGLSIN